MRSPLSTLRRVRSLLFHGPQSGKPRYMLEKRTHQIQIVHKLKADASKAGQDMFYHILWKMLSRNMCRSKMKLHSMSKHVKSKLCSVRIRSTELLKNRIRATESEITLIMLQTAFR
ncbi:hypothetical protein AVEN_122623-1 [Araneus ventricosus]|uniref:Uncharacterized protein n=1 Tax=Araneus ventricosus TaxID=182803 RepID=A0A4Y2FG82_ARAVE|nr:hypothetical protein AVEN_122623-1 [Araneus ventricosus]